MIIVASAATAVILGSIFVVIPSFAERTVTYEKLLDVKKEFLFLALTDIKNYGQVFPENIKKIDLIQEDIGNSARMVGEWNGRFFDEKVAYNTQSDDTFSLNVITGDFKGTKMTTTLTETWGFDGSRGGGTMAKTVLKIKSNWFYSIFIDFANDEQIKFALDGVFDKFVQRAKDLESGKIPTTSTPVTTPSITEPPVTTPTKPPATTPPVTTQPKPPTTEPTTKPSTPPTTPPITVRTDSTSYDYGDMIVISGLVKKPEGELITLRILDSNSKLVGIDQFSPAADGSFARTYIATGPLWKATGTYTVIAQYGSAQQADTTFSFTARLELPPITVSTDKNSYRDGETILIFGKTSEYLSNTKVTITIINPIGNRVALDEVEVGTDKTYSTEITAGGSLWKAEGTYTVHVQYGSESRTNETTFEFSGSTGGPSGKTIKVEGTDFSVSYIITNGMVTAMKANPQSLSLIMSIQTTGDGHITLTLPRALIDAKKPANLSPDDILAGKTVDPKDLEDDDFFVLIDGQKVSFKETKSTTSRTLSIGFLKGDSNIVLIGTMIAS